MAKGVGSYRGQSPEDDGGAAVWAFLWVLFAFKLATVALIFWHLSTWETGLLLGATTWHWFPALAALGAGPILFHYRLHKVRSRREALRRAEWMVEAEPVQREQRGAR